MTGGNEVPQLIEVYNKSPGFGPGFCFWVKQYGREVYDYDELELPHH